MQKSNNRIVLKVENYTTNRKERLFIEQKDVEWESLSGRMGKSIQNKSIKEILNTLYDKTKY